jgi:uncharacterized protein (TIGR02246 family)
MLALVGCALLWAACTPTSNESVPAPAKAEDTSGVHGVRDKYVAGENAGDAAAIAALWAADGILMPNHAPAVQGSQAIQAYYQAEAEQGKTELSVTGEETIISGDWAFDRGKFTIKLTTASGTVEDQGKYIVLLSRQADGSWKVARLIFNSDLPMPGAPPAGAAGAEPKDAPAKR